MRANLAPIVCVALAAMAACVDRPQGSQYGPDAARVLEAHKEDAPRLSIAAASSDCFVLHSDGAHLALSSMKGPPGLAIWDLSSGRIVSVWPHVAGCVTAFVGDKVAVFQWNAHIDQTLVSNSSIWQSVYFDGGGVVRVLDIGDGLEKYTAPAVAFGSAGYPTYFGEVPGGGPTISPNGSWVLHLDRSDGEQLELVVSALGGAHTTVRTGIGSVERVDGWELEYTVAGDPLRAVIEEQGQQSAIALQEITAQDPEPYQRQRGDMPSVNGQSNSVFTDGRIRVHRYDDITLDDHEQLEICAPSAPGHHRVYVDINGTIRIKSWEGDTRREFDVIQLFFGLTTLRSPGPAGDFEMTDVDRLSEMFRPLSDVSCARVGRKEMVVQAHYGISGSGPRTRLLIDLETPRILHRNWEYWLNSMQPEVLLGNRTLQGFMYSTMSPSLLAVREPGAGLRTEALDFAEWMALLRKSDSSDLDCYGEGCEKYDVVDLTDTWSLRIVEDANVAFEIVDTNSGLRIAEVSRWPSTLDFELSPRQTRCLAIDFVTDAVLSEDHRWLAIGGLCVRLFDLAAQEFIYDGHYSEDFFTPLSFDNASKCLLFDYASGNISFGIGWAKIEDIAERHNLASEGQIWNYAEGGSAPALLIGEDCSVAYTSRRSQEIVVTGGSDETYSYFEGTPQAMSFAPDGSRFAVIHEGNELTVWKREALTNQWEVRLSWLADGNWLVVTPSGLYDSSSPGDLPDASWVLPSDPLTPLPVESFMRDYYEPGLLGKVLRGERLREVGSLESLNRVLPEAEIVEVEPDGPGTVRVQVRVGHGSREIREAGGGVRLGHTAGVRDLKLFRDGQLVGLVEGGLLPEWTDQQVAPEARDRVIEFAGIKLPSHAPAGRVEFSAYVFNEDWVKSLTARRTYSLQGEMTTRARRAYVVSLGMNVYQNAAWDLYYAADDACAMQQALVSGLEASAEFAEVVGVPLISGRGMPCAGFEGLASSLGLNDWSVAPVTKERVQAVFEALAGRRSALLADIPNGDRLQEANPEDVLIVTYSGHGLADEDGGFHLFPWDIGAGETRRVDEEFFTRRSISSEDLSLWLRDVDAGEIVMVVDACQSATSVEGAGDFRPGPMGSRGLGQLVYDKGMRLLAASQAEGWALESSRLRHGLLTYALLREGLDDGEADAAPVDGVIDIAEWLRYGHERVPRLYEQILTGDFQERGEFKARAEPLQLEEPASGSGTKRASQQPALFDFRRFPGEELVLSTRP